MSDAVVRDPAVTADGDGGLVAQLTMMTWREGGGYGASCLELDLTVHGESYEGATAQLLAQATAHLAEKQWRLAARRRIGLGILPVPVPMGTGGIPDASETRTWGEEAGSH